MTIANLADLRRLIGRRNLAELADLGRRAKVPYSTVHKVARGYTTNPKLATFVRLARAVAREGER